MASELEVQTSKPNMFTPLIFCEAAIKFTMYRASELGGCNIRA
jgi:hypothetical protein